MKYKTITFSEDKLRAYHYKIGKKTDLFIKTPKLKGHKFTSKLKALLIKGLHKENEKE